MWMNLYELGRLGWDGRAWSAKGVRSGTGGGPRAFCSNIRGLVYGARSWKCSAFCRLWVTKRGGYVWHHGAGNIFPFDPMDGFFLG